MAQRCLTRVGRLGKSIVFAVNQTHATNLTKIFNELVPGIVRGAKVGAVRRRRSGAIRLAGSDITRLRPDQRAHAGIGWVPQERNSKRGKSRGSQAVAHRCLTIVGKYGISVWFGTASREPR